MTKPTPEEIKTQIIDLYLSGLNITQLSRQFSISNPTITKILKKVNVQIRTTNGRELHLNKELINELYISGLSTYEISKRFKCSDETIRKLIISPRSISERNKRTHETIQKIKESCKNLWNNDEYVRKTREGYKEWSKTFVPLKRLQSSRPTEETKRKISEAIKSKFQDPKFLEEHKFRCSQSSQKRAEKTTSNRKNEFIEKSKFIHDDKYDYSKVIFINAYEKVEIICPEHGSFWQAPYSHVNDHGCPKCFGTFKKSTEDFIKEAIEIHGNKYDYSKVEYSINKNKVEIICPKHGSFFQRPDSHICRENGCPKCPSVISKDHQKILNILPLNISSINNDKCVLEGTEIDILLPEYNVGIEVNGTYWHGLRMNNGKRHASLKKTHHQKASLASEVGIKLFQFWNFEIEQKPELIKSMIYNSIGLSNRVHARKCDIIRSDNSNSKDFFEESHLQGHRNASAIYSLVINNETQCAISFSRHKDYEWEIIRFACKKGISVVGGFSRLLKHFIKEHKPKNILTFADRRISTGNLYIKNGFKQISITEPNYFYCKNNLVISRQRCQKHKLLRLLGDSFKPDSSETENMLLNGFSKVYDAGHIKLVMDI